MFTGIIEEKGSIEKVLRGGERYSLVIRAEKLLAGVKIGDSIATNGVCLTVTELGKSNFTVDVMPETMRQSNLGKLVPGDRVNLERALQLGGRVDGHLVSGHIDGCGRIKAFKPEGNAIRVEITASADILKYIILRGSIAVDGVSLTVAGLNSESFEISLIPLTRKETTLPDKKIGEELNLEGDLIGKYVARFLGSEEKPEEKRNGLSMEKLAQAGFL